MNKFNYPSDKWELQEQARYKIRLAQHAEDQGYDSVEEYIADSSCRYVILSAADQPQHWWNDDLIPDERDPENPDISYSEEDETDWCIYDSREEAEHERQWLIKEKDFGHRVVTERYFLKMKGLI